MRARDWAEWLLLAILWPVGLPLVLLARPQWSVGRRYAFLTLSGFWAVVSLLFTLTALGLGNKP